MRIGEAQNVQTSSIVLTAGVASLRFPAPLQFFLQANERHQWRVISTYSVWLSITGLIGVT